MKKNLLNGFALVMVFVASIFIILFAPTTIKWMLDFEHLSIVRAMVLVMFNAPAIAGLIVGIKIRKKYK